MKNKIIITNQEIREQLDNSINIEFKDNFIPKLIINVNNSTSLEIIFENMIDKKMEVEIKLFKNCHLTLLETKTGEKGKLLFKYDLESESEIDIFKVHDVITLQEQDFFQLNGENSKVNSILKTVGIDKENYNMTINHNAKATSSNIINHGVNVSGVININVTTSIPNKITKCEANQVNRIINLTNNHCIIRPNLLIEEYDCFANHSAYIGPFTKDELFYLNRLGISSELAKSLLIKGFINSKIKEEYTQILEKYWR